MRRYRRYRGYSNYGYYVVSKRNQLSSMYSGIDRDVERIFLSLSREDLSELLETYEEQHGRSAATYARSTYPKWKSGKVRMSGQVAERLLILLPPLLPQEVRLELVKKLRTANFRPLTKYISVTAETWRDALGPVILEVLKHGRNALLPDRMKEQLEWLADGDIAAAEKLWMAAEQDAAINKVNYIEREFQRIQQMLEELENLDTFVHHAIELPQGTINVSFVTPKKSIWQRISSWLG